MAIPLRFDILPGHHAAVARTFLAARAAERHHLVAYLSGAHAYGFPSPDSDLDIKCVHVAPTRRLVGLGRDPGGAEQLTTIDGVELDYGSNELGDVLAGVVKGNGNYLERLLGDLVLAADQPRLAALRPLVRAVLSRNLVRHYGGFAGAQRRAAQAAPTAKKLLYVLRTAATGLHLLRTGELIIDLNLLAPDLGLDLAGLLERKRSGERAALTGDELAGWQTRLDAVMTALDAAVATSVLPDQPPAPAVAALDAWLCEVRRELW